MHLLRVPTTHKFRALYREQHMMSSFSNGHIRLLHPPTPADAHFYSNLGSYSAVLPSFYAFLCIRRELQLNVLSLQVAPMTLLVCIRTVRVPNVRTGARQCASNILTWNKPILNGFVVIRLKSVTANVFLDRIFMWVDVTIKTGLP